MKQVYNCEVKHRQKQAITTILTWVFFYKNGESGKDYKQQFTAKDWWREKRPENVDCNY